MKIPHGFIREFSDHLLKRYGNRINADYAFALSEIVLSSCCWNIHFVDNFGKGQPNIWVQVILPSGDVKSKPINELIRPIINLVEEKLNQEKSENEPKLQLVISQYTPESIINLMSGTKKRKGDKEDAKQYIGNLGVIIQDESSMMTRGIKNKDYMSGLMEINSMIYDGKIPERFTNSMGLSKVPYCYKACISATTPVIYAVMDEGDVIQGGWNRYDIITGIPIENIKPHDPKSFFQHRTQEEIDNELEYYAIQLLNVISTPCTMIYFSDDAAQLWCDYEYKQQIMKRQINEKDLRRGYKNRMAEKVLKRAVLYTISRYIQTIQHAKLGEILVDEEEMQMAIDNQEEYYSHWQHMLSEWKLAPKTGESKLTTDTAHRDRLKAIIKLAEHVSRQRVIEESGWNDGSKYLMDTLGSFITEHKVEQITQEESRRLIQQHINDPKWIEWQRIKLPMRGQAPNFYKWIGE